MEYRMTVLVKIDENGNHVIQCSQCGQNIHHRCQEPTQKFTKRTRKRSSLSPERLLQQPEFRHFDFSPKKQHVLCHPCNKNVITLGTKQTVFESDLERHQRTKKHGKRTSQHTLLKPHYHASSSGITKQKDWNIKSVICPACNKPVLTSSMRMHVKTTFHKSNV
ncbi:hypothetical protein RvY_18275 [Ramazzottius varieornatus]|uniref:Uncharacterized protein n=1 Tax=Ramazzottius varieornatus TaxID=947166 RepID=A0A1D1W549_RAMVA|nr:hypothetical protein RvY_18275 [Ramazzottius varieornatus]